MLLRTHYPIGLSQFICLSCSGGSVFIDYVRELQLQEVSWMPFQQWSVVGVLQGQVLVWSDNLRHDRIIFSLNVLLYEDLGNTTFWRLYLIPLQSLSSYPPRRVGDVFWIVLLAPSRRRGGRVGEQFLWCFWHINSACTFYLPSLLSQGLYLYLLSQHAVFSVPSPISIFSLSPVPFKSAIATKNFSSSKEVSLASDFWQKREDEPRDQIPRETLQLSN